MDAADRYVKLDTKTLPDGRVVYRTARPRSVTTSTNDFSFYANERDRLDIIAANVFGSAMDWWRVAAANNRVNGSLHLIPGQKIIIPKG